MKLRRNYKKKKKRPRAEIWLKTFQMNTAAGKRALFSVETFAKLKWNLHFKQVCRNKSDPKTTPCVDS